MQVGKSRGHSPQRLPALEVCLGAKFKALLYHPVAAHHTRPVLSTAVRSLGAARSWAVSSVIEVRPRGACVPGQEIGHELGGKKWDMSCRKAGCVRSRGVEPAMWGGSGRGQSGGHRPWL